MKEDGILVQGRWYCSKKDADFDPERQNLENLNK